MTPERPAPELVVVGGSAGGVEAVGAILAGLPATFRLPIVVVLHVPEDRPSLLPDVLGPRTRLAVVEVEDKTPIVPGTVYCAPPGYHLLVERDRTLALSIDPPVRYSRPSIDVLFESAAEAVGDAAIGVVLTGANADGAEGLRALAEAGAMTIVQAPETAIADAMPRAAIALARPDRVLSLRDISAFLSSLGGPA